MKVPDAKEIGITIRTHKLMNKALMLCGLHKFKKSVNCVDKVIELNPKLAKAWNLKGFVYAHFYCQSISIHIIMKFLGHKKITLTEVSSGLPV